LAGAKEKMRVATTLPAVFTRVSSLFLLECHPIISNSKAEGKVPHSHNSHWLTLISSCWAAYEYVFPPLGSSKRYRGL
jgi:hypothetical protein